MRVGRSREPFGVDPNTADADRRAGDRVAEPNIALAPGLPVRMTIVNRTHEFHPFTVTGLGVSELIRPAHGSTPGQTTFTFTANQWGVFAWHCLICPSGKHGRPHAMGGLVRAEIDVLVLISNCPQINNPCNGFDPTPIRLIVTAAS